MRLGGSILVGAVVLAAGLASAAAQPAPERRTVLLPVVGGAPPARTPVDEKAAGAATATAVAGLPILPATTGPGVAELLASPPPAGQPVEVDAYFAGADPRTMRKGRPMGPDQVPCPDRPASLLTDRSFPPSFSVLNMTASNLPPDDSPWLAAVTADVAQPGSNRFTVLPYHARLRGRFGEPTLAHCPRPERVFLVEAIVATYPTKPPPLPTPFWTVGPGHAAWPRHHEPRFGLSLAVPPGWGVEPLAEPETLGGLVVRMPGLESYPVRLRVHQGESWYDWYAPWSRPPFFDGAQSYGPYPQGRFAAWGPTQGLAGWHASRAFGSERGESVLFNGGGRTHELVLRYPTGYDVSQELLTGYTGIVEGFALDQHPGPTPTPPIKQALGPGPFLSEARARARVRELAGADVELLSARLIPEAEARGLSGLCNTFSGHPDGVWLLTVRGSFHGRVEERRWYLEATTGESLCGEPADAPRPLPTWTPGGAPPTPGPTATPAPTQGPPHP